MVQHHRQTAHVWALILAVSCLFGWAQRATALIFTDGDFVLTQWNGQILNYGNASGSAITETSGGAPGSNKSVALWSTSNWLHPYGRVIWVDMKPSATVTPATLGGITTVDYMEDQHCFCAGAGILWGPVVEQNGVYYFVPGNVIPATIDFTWDTFLQNGLTAADFDEVNVTGLSWTDPNSHPDFSAAGAPVTFGYARALYADTSITSYLDNWTVTVNESAVATETTQWGTIKGLFR